MFDLALAALWLVLCVSTCGQIGSHDGDCFLQAAIAQGTLAAIFAVKSIDRLKNAP